MSVCRPQDVDRKRIDHRRRSRYLQGVLQQMHEESSQDTRNQRGVGQIRIAPVQYQQQGDSHQSVPENGHGLPQGRIQQTAQLGVNQMKQRQVEIRQMDGQCARQQQQRDRPDERTIEGVG